MTQSEALSLDEDLQQLKALRENRVWKNHVLPEIARLRDEHRTGLRDHTLTPEARCEHATAWEDAQSLLGFLDKQEAKIRAQLREFDSATPIIERRFSSEPA